MLYNTQSSRQSLVDRTFMYSENGLKIIGTAKGVWGAGRTIYSAGQAIAPYAAAAISLL
jgi:hypothetical protein